MPYVVVRPARVNNTPVSRQALSLNSPLPPLRPPPPTLPAAWVGTWAAPWLPWRPDLPGSQLSVFPLRALYMVVRDQTNTKEPEPFCRCERRLFAEPNRGVRTGEGGLKQYCRSNEMPYPTSGGKAAHKVLLSFTSFFVVASPSSSRMSDFFHRRLSHTAYSSALTSPLEKKKVH